VGDDQRNLGKRLKHRPSYLWLTLIITVCFFQASPAHAEPEVQAQNAILMDVDSKRVLYQKRAEEERPIASITKIMTAILAIEYGKLDDQVVVSPNACRMEGSSIYLRPGEKVRLETLLYGLILRSGNDAAVAIAEHLAGSEEAFTDLMNAKAWELGMNHTHFANSHGLDQDGHYSSARDMAILAAYALKNPVFREIVKTEKKRVSWLGEEWQRSWRNKNKMLHLYEGADGVKTGFTRKAGRTLVSSATRNGQQLVVVTLNDPDDWRDHASLLDYGFVHYPQRVLLEEGQEVPAPPQWRQLNRRLEIGKTFKYPLAEDEIQDIQVRVILTDLSANRLQEAPKGTQVGKVIVTFQGKQLAALPIQISGR